MNAKPSRFLPTWARDYFERNWSRFDNLEDRHRCDAFYRLLCSDDPDMRAVWEHADLYIGNRQNLYAQHVAEADQDGFIGGLIYSMDDVLEDESVPLYEKPIQVLEERLREPDRNLARKLARQYYEMAVVTPPRCQAYSEPVVKFAGGQIERLIIRYYFQPAAPDVNGIYRLYGIEFTSSSKRGWRARRKASDVARNKVIKSARRLAKIGHEADKNWLNRIADDLESLPDMETEHRYQPEMVSNKSTWADWLRVAYKGMRGIGSEDNFLRLRDWAALARVLFDNPDINEANISQALRDCDGSGQNFKKSY